MVFSNSQSTMGMVHFLLSKMCPRKKSRAMALWKWRKPTIVSRKLPGLSRNLLPKMLRAHSQLLGSTLFLALCSPHSRKWGLGMGAHLRSVLRSYGGQARFVSLTHLLLLWARSLCMGTFLKGRGSIRGRLKDIRRQSGCLDEFSISSFFLLTLNSAILS